MGGWVGGWMDGWMDGWMHGCMDAWMHGCMMDVCIHIVLSSDMLLLASKVIILVINSANVHM